MHGARERVCFQGPSPSCWNHCRAPNGAAQAEGTACAKAPRRKERRLMGGPDRRARSRETAVETIRRTAQGQGVMKPWRPLYEVQRLS